MTTGPRVIFEVPIRVINTPRSSMPTKYLGASVAAYTFARREIDMHLLIEFVASAVEEQGLDFDHQLADASIIELEHWDNYVDGRWGDLEHGLPSASRLLSSLERAVYFGPFACFVRFS